MNSPFVRFLSELKINSDQVTDLSLKTNLLKMIYRLIESNNWNFEGVRLVNDIGARRKAVIALDGLELD